MTHLICGVGKSSGDADNDDSGALAQARTIKYLMAVASNNTIVTPAWLKEWRRRVEAEGENGVSNDAAADDDDDDDESKSTGKDESKGTSSQPTPPPAAAKYAITGVWRKGRVHALPPGDRGKTFAGVSFFFSESYDRIADSMQPRAPKRRDLQVRLAVLCSAVLCCTVLCCAVLCCAVLCCTVLCCAVLCSAVLCCAMLCCAVLCCALLG